MAEDYFGIVGTTQGSYRIEAVVAEGGFGVVYRAYHDAFQAPVALKCLKIPVQLDTAHREEFLSKFKEEAALLFRLSSSIPAVVRPLHVDQVKTSDERFVPYMAMEWLEGEGLDALIARRANEGLPPLGLKKVVRMLTPVARALARAHHFPTPEGPIAIVHRDLKPDNIFIAKVNDDEVVKIFDFGIAKARSAATQVAGRLSQSGSEMTAFTPGYGAPEQWLPKRFGQTGPWTDVFGLALTVLEAAIGRPIIDGDTAGMMGTSIDEKRRPTPRTEGMEVTDRVEAVFLSALAVDPRERYPDAGKFWDALESALGLTLSATPTLGEKRSWEAPSETFKLEDLVPRGSLRSSIDLATQTELGRQVTANEQLPDLELDLPPLSKASQSARGMAPHKRTVPPPANEPPESKRPSGSLLTNRSMTGSIEAPQGQMDISLEVDNGPAPSRAGGSIHEMRPSKRDPMASGGYPRSSAGDAAPPSRIVAPAVPIRGKDVSTPSVMSRIRTPLYVGVVGLLLSLADQVALLVTDRSFALGPVRLTWVAALLTVVGVVIVMKRLILPEDGS
jgi:serine/threonine-protein kinase